MRLTCPAAGIGVAALAEYSVTWPGLASTAASSRAEGRLFSAEGAAGAGCGGCGRPEGMVSSCCGGARAALCVVATLGELCGFSAAAKAAAAADLALTRLRLWRGVADALLYVDCSCTRVHV